MEDLKCPRCGGKMEYFLSENIQLGKTGWIFGDLPNLLAGGLAVDIYRCENCRKLEFYQSQN